MKQMSPLINTKRPETKSFKITEPKLNIWQELQQEYKIIPNPFNSYEDSSIFNKSINQHQQELALIRTKSVSTFTDRTRHIFAHEQHQVDPFSKMKTFFKNKNNSLIFQQMTNLNNLTNNQVESSKAIEFKNKPGQFFEFNQRQQSLKIKNKAQSIQAFHSFGKHQQLHEQNNQEQERIFSTISSDPQANQFTKEWNFDFIEGNQKKCHQQLFSLDHGKGQLHNILTDQPSQQECFFFIDKDISNPFQSKYNNKIIENQQNIIKSNKKTITPSSNDFIEITPKKWKKKKSMTETSKNYEIEIVNLEDVMKKNEGVSRKKGQLKQIVSEIINCIDELSQEDITNDIVTDTKRILENINSTKKIYRNCPSKKLFMDNKQNKKESSQSEKLCFKIYEVHKNNNNQVFTKKDFGKQLHKNTKIQQHQQKEEKKRFRF